MCSRLSIAGLPRVRASLSGGEEFSRDSLIDPPVARSPVPEICRMVQALAKDRRAELTREIRECDETLVEMETMLKSEEP